MPTSSFAERKKIDDPVHHDDELEICLYGVQRPKGSHKEIPKNIVPYGLGFLSGQHNMVIGDK